MNHNRTAEYWARVSIWHRLLKTVLLVSIAVFFLLSACACNSAEDNNEKNSIEAAIQGRWTYSSILGSTEIRFKKGDFTLTETLGLSTFIHTGFYQIDTENEEIYLYEKHRTSYRSDYPDYVFSDDENTTVLLTYSYNSKSGEITLWSELNDLLTKR